MGFLKSSTRLLGCGVLKHPIIFYQRIYLPTQSLKLKQYFEINQDLSQTEGPVQLSLNICLHPCKKNVWWFDQHVSWSWIVSAAIYNIGNKHNCNFSLISGPNLYSLSATLNKTWILSAISKKDFYEMYCMRGQLLVLYLCLLSTRWSVFWFVNHRE